MGDTGISPLPVRIDTGTMIITKDNVADLVAKLSGA